MGGGFSRPKPAHLAGWLSFHAPGVPPAPFTPAACCPLCCKQVTSFTGGYVVDNRLGNTGGYGAAFGILTAIGVTIPKPNSLQWDVAVAVNGVLTALDKAFGKKE